jgi:UDP-glucose 4-epimerase
MGVNDLRKRKIVVTGGAGFIGSNLIQKLDSTEFEIVVIDNLNTGNAKTLDEFKVKFIKFDLYQESKDLLAKHIDGAETIYHFAANADVRNGWKRPRVDLEQNTIATNNLLEASAKVGIQKFVFSSTGSIYGEAKVLPTQEFGEMPIQTSLYGASKLAAESFIQAYGEANKFSYFIFRFVSILGPGYTHGHVLDFMRQLHKNPKKLHVLGNGKQKKSYLHVFDCIKGVLHLSNQNGSGIYNLGTNEYSTVDDSIRWICSELKISPEITYTGEKRGWVGDNPFIWLDTKKANDSGWQPTYSIEKSVIETVQWLKTNTKILES